LKASGITVEPGQPVKIVARTEDGKTTERTYETMGGAPWNRERETVSVTEKITRIYVESEGKIAWENRSVSTPPYMLHRKEGQSIGQAAAASNQYNLAFLNSVRVPAYVPKVREKLGLGTSGFAQ
jgi:hypothetical protein